MFLKSFDILKKHLTQRRLSNIEICFHLLFQTFLKEVPNDAVSDDRDLYFTDFPQMFQHLGNFLFQNVQKLLEMFDVTQIRSQRISSKFCQLWNNSPFPMYF